MMRHFARRRDILAGAAAAGSLIAASAAAAPARSATLPRARRGDEFAPPVATPPQHPVTEGMVDVDGAKLYYRDTGGGGTPILLAHPGSGSALIWEYQQPVFAAAGLRVVAWSRRGHARSETPAAALAGDATADIDRLVDALGLGRFHALGSAAGGGVMLDYALARGARLKSLVIASSIGNIADPDYRRASELLRPHGFNDMPAAFRELGPCYRAANPDGAARWAALERDSRTAPMGPPPAPAAGGRPGTGWADLARLRMPILWLTGDADLFTPPPLLTEFRRRTSGSEMAIIDGAGHSAYWEQPAAFNAAVLDFLARRGG